MLRIRRSDTSKPTGRLRVQAAARSGLSVKMERSKMPRVRRLVTFATTERSRTRLVRQLATSAPERLKTVQERRSATRKVLIPNTQPHSSFSFLSLRIRVAAPLRSARQRTYYRLPNNRGLLFDRLREKDPS